MEIYVNIFLISVFPFLFFLGFKHDFIIYVDFTGIAASNTATDDVTHLVTHRICNKNIKYSYALFVIKIDEKSSLTYVF